MKFKSIAVLITCFNRKDKTLSCLRDLYNQKGLNDYYELVVFLTDDGSVDGTSQEVLKIYPKVRVIQGTGSLYWNRGMKVAWDVAAKEAAFDYFLWMNDDVTLFDNAIEELLYCVDDKIPSLVCGAFMSNKDKSFSYGAMDIKGRKIIPDGKIRRDGAIINGNAVLINRKSFEQVGMLDEVFPHGIGDHDYGLRLLRKKGQVITTRSYIGSCDKNERLPKWCYKNTPFLERVKSLYSPLGYAHPYYFFIYERRHFGLARACTHFLSIHLRLLFPSLWK